jgi:hypothetical protein
MVGGLQVGMGAREWGIDCRRGGAGSQGSSGRNERCEARTKVVLSTTRLRLAIGKKSAQGLLHLPTAGVDLLDRMGMGMGMGIGVLVPTLRCETVSLEEPGRGSPCGVAMRSLDQERSGLRRATYLM